MSLSNRINCSFFLLFLFIFPHTHIDGMVYASMKMRVKIDKGLGWILIGDLLLKKNGFMLSADSLFLPDKLEQQVVLADFSIGNSFLDINAKKGFITRDFKEMRLKDGLISFNGFSSVLSYKNFFLAEKTGFFIDGVLVSGSEKIFISSGFILFNGDALVIKDMQKKVIFSAKKQKWEGELF